MANSRKSTRKTGNVAQFPPPESGVAVADEPEPNEPMPEASTEGAEPQQSPAQPPKRERGRPKATDAPIETDFWKRVKAIPRADWGTRVFLYLYILEPLCNLKQSGGKVYLNRYAEPVQDEHQICMEYGSGRYRLMLAYNKVSPDQSNELARYEFEIYNPQHPPKVPRAAWINDARNAKWEALLPKETPATPATAASTIVDAMKMVSDIRRDVRAEIEPEPADAQSPSEMVQTFKAMKEILQPTPASGTTAATPPADPFDTAAKIMAMRANDPMMAVMMELLKNANAANEAARQREYELLQKQAATPPKGLLDQLIELAAMGDKLEPLKKLFGFGNGAAEVAGRAARTTGLDVVRDLVTGPAGATLAQGIGVLISNLASATSANPASPPKPPPIVMSGANPDGTAPQENAEQRINRIGETITRAMLFEFFLKDEDSGEAFAQWMFDGAPKDYIFIRTYGAEELIRRYRRVPEAWPVIQAKEAEFLKFLQAFCAWDPNTEDGPAPPSNGDDGVVDLEPEATS